MKQRILAVDDEVHMLKLFERIITEKTGYQIITTSNSLEVPGMLEEDRYDLIITDLKMPGLDGLDLLRMIKEKERDEEVIIITAFGSLESAIEALSRGVFDYITKPFKKEQILYTVDRAMKWVRIKREAARMDDIFSREPYESALESFRKEYIRRLAERLEGDKQKMAQQSGLAEDVIEAVLGSLANEIEE